DSGRDAHFAVGLHLHLGALVGTDAGAFYVAGDSDPDAAALRPQARLLVVEELIVTDEIERLVENRRVIAAVVFESREILIDDAVVIGESIGRDEVAAANFRAVDAEIARRDIEKAFDNEDAMLAAGAPIGRDDRRVGEDRGKRAVVVRHHVGAEKRALA